MERPRCVYRRRRIAGALLAAIIAAAFYASVPADAGGPPTRHTVTPGETLWSIAVEHYPPSEDPRESIEAIRQANDLEGYRIEAGDHLELPPAE